MTALHKATMETGELLSNLSEILKGVSSDLVAIEKVLAESNHPHLKLLQGMDVLDQVILNLAAFMRHTSHSCQCQCEVEVVDPLSQVTLAHLREQILGVSMDANGKSDGVDFF